VHVTERFLVSNYSRCGANNIGDTVVENHLLSSRFCCSEAVFSFTRTESSAMLERIVCSCDLLNPVPEGTGLLSVAGPLSRVDEESLLLDATWFMTAERIRVARQMTPKPMNTCCRASERLVGDGDGEGFWSVMFGEIGGIEFGGNVECSYLFRSGTQG
jgi:hypothetical protein